MVTAETILQALAQIIDPDFKQDIVSLGFVQNLSIEQGVVSFDIQLTTAACPLKQEFKHQAEQTVLALEGVSDVHVRMTASTKRRLRLDEHSGLMGVKSLVGVSSCKGGVGKSTVAALLARELADRGFKVGLLDLDIFGPSVPTLFGRHGKASVTGSADEKTQKYVPVEVNGLKLMSFGFLAGDAPAVMRGPMVSSYAQVLLHRVAWGELDYLFIDFPPGTGDIQLTITQSVPLDGAIIVTTRQSLSLVDVAKGILMFEKVNVPVLGVIENMVYTTCAHCGEPHYLFGEAVSPLTERFGLECLAQLPLASEWMRPVDASFKSNDLLREMTNQVVRAIGKHSRALAVRPELAFDAKGISLSWPDGTSQFVPARLLRLACRCAYCVDEFTGKPLLNPDNVPLEVAPLDVLVLGNYALSVKWSDGHSSGIYPFARMKALG